MVCPDAGSLDNGIDLLEAVEVSTPSGANFTEFGNDVANCDGS